MAVLFVSYTRVSTAKQGESGLGLDAQRRAVAAHVAAAGGEVIDEFQEIESGKRADRPALAAAIARCRATGARLLIAKLDRLSRDAHFLLGLEKQGVDFVAADMPHATRLTVGIMALVAQEEREAISRRTRAGLASIKARIDADGAYTARSGRVLTRLGNPDADAIRRGSAAGVERFQANADAFAGRVGATVRALFGAEGSMNRVAARLNEMGAPTARGGRWTAKAVSRVLERTAPAA